MAIDFPNSPATNATYTVGNKTWIYDGATWNTYNTTSFSAETLPGTTIKSTVTGSSLTGVGTLSSLAVTGDLTVDTTTLKVDSTANRVGVGTNNPGALLDVLVGGGSDVAMRVTNAGTGNSFLVEDSASTDTTPFVINSSGQVGIGMTNPARSLDVIGNIRATLNATQDGIELQGRVGGTSSYAVTITPTTLTSSRTLTLPDTTGDLAAFTSARGTNTAWTTYTSTITQLGNVTFSTQVSRYCQIGKLIHWQFSLAVTGSGTISNAIRINLPQTAQANATYSNYGTMHVYDASANTHYTGHAFAYSTTQAGMMLNTGTTYFQTIALASSDIISGHIIYEAA
jgi:hypothetical protein